MDKWELNKAIHSQKYLTMAERKRQVVSFSQWCGWGIRSRMWSFIIGCLVPVLIQYSGLICKS